MDSATKAILQGLIVGLVNSGKLDASDWSEIVFQIEKATYECDGAKDGVKEFMRPIRPQLPL